MGNEVKRRPEHGRADGTKVQLQAGCRLAIEEGLFEALPAVRVLFVEIAVLVSKVEVEVEEHRW